MSASKSQMNMATILKIGIPVLLIVGAYVSYRIIKSRRLKAKLEEENILADDAPKDSGSASPLPPSAEGSPKSLIKNSKVFPADGSPKSLIKNSKVFPSESSPTQSQKPIDQKIAEIMANTTLYNQLKARFNNRSGKDVIKFPTLDSFVRYTATQMLTPQ